MAKKRSSASSAQAEALRSCGLGEFIVRVSEGLTEPVHLAPFLDALARAEAGEPVRAVIAIPCQHSKTTTIQHAIAWMLLRNPKQTLGYATYSKTFAGRNSRVIRRIAESAGVQLSEEQNTIAEWQTDEHGGCVATSIDGELTGYKLDHLFIDDPYKNRGEAESQLSRESVSDWFRGVAQTRLTPKGSAFVVASRWHQEDLSGELIAKGWENITLPAISPEGLALCPWGPDPENPRTIEFLVQLRAAIGDYDFESLYQGNPRPASGSVFQAPTFAQRPLQGRITVGLDLAYTGGASADYSAAVALQWTDAGAHVLEVARWRTGPTELAGSLRAFLGNYPGASVASFVSGPERAIYTLLAAQGIAVSLLAATGVGGSKYLRSQACAAAWNSGALTIPERAPWVDAFVREVRLFTGGAGDSHDDQVDALASAWQAATLGISLAGGRPVRGLRR